MYYKCVCLLSKYEERLASYKRSTLSLNFISSYSQVIDAIRKVHDVASVPIFICSIIFFMQLWVNLSWILLIPQHEMLPIYNTEIIFTSVLYTLGALSTPIIASEIPLRMQKIKIELEGLYGNALKHLHVDPKTLKIIKFALKREHVEITACNVVNFTRGYVLSFFSALFAYGLLFISIQDKSILTDTNNSTL
ncbi:hypothetical protein TNIN_222141 [Trichonephila inaurata madagascariensis]|uniref:Uncharacterized protein n=1 Tax=Trichonephila inaurata madagascariensis TaxID=2747483 RepID=A0A8X6MA47_9ARAC|nr:hypothetical protein TNIN_222141 [Trichonephila inaurata madagascariensis]